MDITTVLGGEHHAPRAINRRHNPRLLAHSVERAEQVAIYVVVLHLKARDLFAVHNQIVALIKGEGLSGEPDSEGRLGDRCNAVEVCGGVDGGSLSDRGALSIDRRELIIGGCCLSHKDLLALSGDDGERALTERGARINSVLSGLHHVVAEVSA